MYIATEEDGSQWVELEHYKLLEKKLQITEKQDIEKLETVLKNITEASDLTRITIFGLSEVGFKSNVINRLESLRRELENNRKRISNEIVKRKRSIKEV